VAIGGNYGLWRWHGGSTVVEHSVRTAKILVSSVCHCNSLPLSSKICGQGYTPTLRVGSQGVEFSTHVANWRWVIGGNMPLT
jgi:hypothetical protein